MKYIIVLILCLVIGASCKKEIITEVKIIPKNSKSISLTVDTINDSTLVLKWSKYIGNDFISYSLNRISRIFKDGSFVNSPESLKIFTDADSLTYLEQNMKFATNISYFITVNTDSSKNSITSNVDYIRTDTYSQAPFTDVLIDRQQKVLYLIDEYGGNISIYNYITNKLINRINLKETIGYSALGTFEGTHELYIPTADGWLYIMDAVSLILKDKIYVGGGEGLGSVVSDRGKLFVSTSDKSYSSFNESKAIKIYDRKSKKLLARTGLLYYTRLVPLENTELEFIDIALSPSNLKYYKLDSEGGLITVYNHNHSGSINPHIIRSFPDGKKFITSTSGSIFTKELKLERKLDFSNSSGSGKYSDFAFNSSASIIYGALLNKKTIEAIAYPAITIEQTFTTKLFPEKIFRDGNLLICISKEAKSYGNSNIFFIEKFDL